MSLVRQWCKIKHLLFPCLIHSGSISEKETDAVTMIDLMEVDGQESNFAFEQSVLGDEWMENGKQGSDDSDSLDPDSICHPDEVHLKYTFNKFIEQGGSACVFFCTRRETGEERALKAIPLQRPEYTAMAMVEIDISLALSHDNIVKCFEAALYPDICYLELELMNHDLYDYLHRMGSAPLTPGESATVMQQILRGVEYLHNENIIHRDIKSENIFMNTIYKVKIGDFGLCERVDDIEALGYYGDTGTEGTRAPELELREKYCGKCDIWSCGVIFYELLTGQKLIDTKKQQSALVQMVFLLDVNQCDLPEEEGIFIGFEAIKPRLPNTRPEPVIPQHIDNLDIIDSAKLLLAQMLFFDPCRRPTATMCLLDSFFDHSYLTTYEDVEEEIYV